MKKILLMCLVGIIAFAGVIRADGGCAYEKMIQSDDLGARAPARLAHGISNILSSPFQVFTETRYAVKNENHDLITGFGQGIVTSGKYLLLGGWDALTFWVPGQSGKDLAVKDCGMANLSKGACETCKKPSDDKKPLEETK